MGKPEGDNTVNNPDVQYVEHMRKIEFPKILHFYLFLHTLCSFSKNKKYINLLFMKQYIYSMI